MLSTNQPLVDGSIPSRPILTAREGAASRSQFVTLKSDRRQHRNYPPNAFTEKGVALLASVLVLLWSSTQPRCTRSRYFPK